MASLIFVAVAVAWALYLIPKALQSHEHATRARSVERFSHTMRVLARREPVDHRRSRLVVPGRSGAVTTSSLADAAAEGAPASAPPSAEAAAPAVVLSPAQVRARREASKRAAKRRRRVLGLLLVSLAAVAGVAAYGLLEWWYVAIPAGLLVAWLVACRLMVKGEHRAWDRLVAPPAAAEAEPTVDEEATTVIDTASLADSMTTPGMWDPVPVTLPTYVSMAAATRTVRTIDLDADGVWTSGRTEADAALARQSDAADQAARAARQAEGDQPRAVGSAG